MTDKKKEQEERRRELVREYNNLLHALQSGVASKMAFNPNETQPKHLRLGVNNALIESGALSQLLIEKGIITEEEHIGMIIRFLRREVAAYEKVIGEHYGAQVTLG